MTGKAVPGQGAAFLHTLNSKKRKERDEMYVESDQCGRAEGNAAGTK
jgi:hypothetical protein